MSGRNYTEPKNADLEGERQKFGLIYSPLSLLNVFIRHEQHRLQEIAICLNYPDTMTASS